MHPYSAPHLKTEFEHWHLGTKSIHKAASMGSRLVQEDFLYRRRLHGNVEPRFCIQYQCRLRCQSWRLPTWLLQCRSHATEAIIKNVQAFAFVSWEWRFVRWWRYRIPKLDIARGMVELTGLKTRLHMELLANPILVHNQEDERLLGNAGKARNQNYPL